MKSTTDFEEIKNTLSKARLSTYEKVTLNTEKALELYQWNLQISSALLECLAVCEVVIRNGISEALEKIYAKNWTKDSTFLASLPQNARQTLTDATIKNSLTDKIIPELPFFFWQSMFTKRFDKKIWNDNLLSIFPNIGSKDIKAERVAIYDDLDELRKLRNRIAHHEPIFNRKIEDDYALIKKIIAYRSKETANWLDKWQNVSALIKQKP